MRSEEIGRIHNHVRLSHRSYRLSLRQTKRIFFFVLVLLVVLFWGTAIVNGARLALIGTIAEMSASHDPQVRVALQIAARDAMPSIVYSAVGIGSLICYCILFLVVNKRPRKNKRS